MASSGFTEDDIPQILDSGLDTFLFVLFCFWHACVFIMQALMCVCVYVSVHYECFVDVCYTYFDARVNTCMCVVHAVCVSVCTCVTEWDTKRHPQSLIYCLLRQCL